MQISKNDLVFHDTRQKQMKDGQTIEMFVSKFPKYDLFKMVIRNGPARAELFQLRQGKRMINEDLLEWNQFLEELKRLNYRWDLRKGKLTLQYVMPLKAVKD